MLTGVEARLAATVTTLGELTGKVSAVLAAFELEGTAAAEETGFTSIHFVNLSMATNIWV